MEPKEKAEELVANMDKYSDTPRDAHLCAIVAVDEIIKSYGGICDDFICDQETYGDKHYSRMTTYWIDVKGKLEIMK